jgi:Cupin-like domain
MLRTGWKSPGYQTAFASHHPAAAVRYSSSNVRSGSNPFYRPLTLLQNESTGTFREFCLKPERPAVFPRACFRYLPACQDWFTKTSAFNESSPQALNYDHWERYSDTIVPLELTRLPSSHNDKDCDAKGEEDFERFFAPLGLFLDWTRSGQRESAHIYLAQCQLLDLPKSLSDDVPTPPLVSQAGKGDIYDTNLWIGIPPTYTPLHRDPNPNLFIQLAGRKQVRLNAPDAGMRIFSRVRMLLGQSVGYQAAALRGEEMMRGSERRLLEQAVWGDHTSPDGFEYEEGFDAVLEAGDGLFIPKGWWHSMQGAGGGITASVSFIQFTREVQSLLSIYF